MKKFKSLISLLIVTLTVGQSVWAASTFTVTNTSGTSKFVITRTSNTSATETVNYRTVSLSAIAGQHFTVKTGTLTFDAIHNSREVEVTENTPGTDAYKYQNGTSRKYRFEVLDQGGFRLAYTDRTITTGTSVPSSNAFAVKDVIIQTNEYTADDRGYDNNGYKSVSSSSFFTSSNAPKNYLKHIGAQLRMTLSFQAKENDDGYQYLQLLFDNTTNCDGRSGKSNGDPGDPNLSSYMAGFEMNTGTKDDTYRSYTFPILDVESGGKANDPWGYDPTNHKWPLKKQNFKSGSRATDGRIIVPMDFSSIVLRLNASGSSGSDEWAAKNVKAHIQAVDGTTPSRLGNPVISGSRHAKGNTFYVSVPFDEIVTVTGTPTLGTTWGNLSYTSGSGSNVLTFSGTITASAGTALTVNSISGTIKDLAGNELSNAGKAINKNIGTTVDANHTFTIAYDLAGGTVFASNPTEYNYETAAFTLNNPIRTGYAFAGWTGSNGNTPQTTVTIPAGSHGDKTFTANWTAHTYKVRFNANGSTGEMSDQDFTYDVAQNLTANTFSRTGYTYNGWSTTPDGSVVYTDGQEVLNLTTTDGAVVNLYAHWTANTYTVTLDNQSATTTGSTEVTATFDAAMPSITIPKRTGYTFHGYYTTANGSGTKYYNADGTSANNWNIASATTLYAKLTANTYTVKFDSNNGSGTMSDMDFTYDVEQSLTANAFIRTGCTFAGWNTMPDGSGDSYTDGQSVTNLTVGNNDVVILYAQWTDYWGITDGADGSENKPYTITTPAGLDLLASDVNNGINEYGGKYFKLGNDIDYQPNTAWNDTTSTEDNYTAIGNENKAFCGIFDGDSHTVSGIRIYNPDAEYQGLFGRVWGGTVKNITLTDARITGKKNIGGISGQINGNNSPTIQNCLVLNTAINGRYCGAVIGDDYWHNGTLITNYYYGCTVNGTAKAVNVGTKSGDFAGACSVHSLTLSTGVTATGEGVTIGTDTYYASNTTVTLNAPAGYAISSASYNDGADHDITDNTFTMPAADVTVTSDYIMTWASLRSAMQNGGTFTLPYDITATETDTYLYVPNDKTVTLDLNGHTINRNLTAAANNGHVIRVDGTLTINDSSDSNTGSITGGNSKNNCGGVYVWGALIMNGGNIISNTTTKPGGGVYVYHTGTFTMSGGTITGNNAEYGGGVYNDGTFNISGNPVITGNTNSTASKANNVYLTNGKVITVTGALTTGANIGVIMQNNTGVFTSGLNGNGTVANFTCDNSSECGVYLNGNGEASIIVDVWGITDGADGTSEATAYTITTTRDLDLLATRVNNGTGYGADSEHPNGFFFQLGADITYAHKEANEEGADKEDNYTAIGTSQKYSFCGTFDGKDHTISGIRIYKGESKNQGLFGYVYGGTVKNVTLSDAHITGKQNVGGIVGYLTNYDNSTIGSINNCHVDGTVTIQAVVNSAESHGGIVGAGNGSVSNCTSSVTFIDSDGLTTCSKYGGIVGYATGGTISNCLAVGVTIPAVLKMGAIVAVNAGVTLTANYYLNCTVGGNTTNVGNGSVDPNGARSVHSLTLADGVTASGESVTIGTDTYYASNTNVTFTYNGSIPRGYVLDIKVKDANDNDIAVTYSNDTYTFKMPACDATVSGITDVWGIASGADGGEAHPYIISTTAGLDLLAKMVNGTNGYTADKFDGKFFKLGNDITYAHTTDWNDASSIEDNYTSIGFQYNKEFWGTFDGDGHAISGIRIYKGNENCQGLFGYARGTVKNVTLSDARITGCSNVGGIVGYLTDTDQLIGTVNNCHVDGNVAIHTVVSNADYHGGIVGYSYSGTVINCTSQAVLTVADNLTGCNGYGGIVGQQFKGSVSSCLAIGATIPDVGYSKGAIAGRHDSGSLATNYYYNCTIGDVSNATSVGVGPIDINNNNNPEGAVAATILSELETVPSNLSGKVAFRREFTGGKASTICLPFALTDIEGGKAYEFVDVTYDAVDGWVATMNEVTATVANKPYLFLPEGSGSVPVLFHGTAGYDVSGGLATTSGDWTFTGTYTNLTYGTEPMTGHIYGFASKSKTVDGHEIEAGDFVHAKEGASVPPMRCYLTYKNGAQLAPMRTSALGATGNEEEIPSRITVKLVSSGGVVTSVGTLDMETGEVTVDIWYDMSGRPQDGEPTAPGLYIHNGKTIMIKK